MKDIQQDAHQLDAWTSGDILGMDAWDTVPEWQEAAQADDPWDAPFIPADSDWYEQEHPAWPQAATAGGPLRAVEPYRYPAKGLAANPRLSKRKAPLLSLAVLLLSIAIIAACLVNINQAYASQSAFTARLRQMQGQAFFPGISIDGQNVSGRTPGQIRQQAGQSGFGGEPAVALRLVVDQTAYLFDNSHIPFERNLEPVMETAWSVGRQGSFSILSSGWTPFEYRYRHMANTRQHGESFSTRVSYKPEIVEELAKAVASQTNREAINAVVSSFNFETKSFEVTQDVPGRQLDWQTVAGAMRQALDRKDYQATISLQSTPLLPRVSSADLRNSFTQLAIYQTKTTSDADRNNNIALAAQSINNTTVMPGQEFSFNQTTGQRTIQKGYRGAPAIQGGVLIDDVGGGVCQVSSTLFNAAAQAGMTIVERSPHAWPVSYLDKGLDATVNWPNLDFRFKNNQDTPVFIIAQFSKRTLTIEFYGMLSAPGEGIRLETQLIATESPPRDPLLQFNADLPYGTQKELKQARTGYVVDTFRVYTRGGNEYRREKLFTSKYRMVQQVIEYNQ